MKKLITVSTILILLSITSCRAFEHRTLEQDSDVLVPLLQGSSSKSLSQQMDANDLRGCSVLIEQSPWHFTKYGSEKAGKFKKSNVRYLWDRDQVWKMENGWESHRSIEVDRTEKSYEIGRTPKDPDSSLVYVGKWQYVEKIGKQIRLIGKQHNDPKESSDVIRVEYESLDSQNQKIPEMPLKLIKPAYGDEFCILKWHIKYGYNGIAETYKKLRPGFWAGVFRDYETVITGKIIEAKE